MILQPTNPHPKVALTHGEDRRQTLRQALDLIADEVDLQGRRRIVLKPNRLAPAKPLASTHEDAVAEVLEFLGRKTDQPVTLVEAGHSSGRYTRSGFVLSGYERLARNYDIRFLDTNTDEAVSVQIWDHKLRPLTVRVAKTIVEADYLISVTPPKTHDCVIFTGAIKNVLVGMIQVRSNRIAEELMRWGRLWVSGAPSLPAPGRLGTAIARFLGHDRLKVHQGYPVMNLNLARLARVAFPHLAVLDGHQAMEGAGPGDGVAVPWRIAIASTDALAADALASHLMGFAVDQVGYLSYCHQAGLGQGNIRQVAVVGERPEAHARSFAPHPQYADQLRWQMTNPEPYLTSDTCPPLAERR